MELVACKSDNSHTENTSLELSIQMSDQLGHESLGKLVTRDLYVVLERNTSVF